MNGDDITRRSPQTRARRGLARTFQRMELFTELTVREHLVVARRVHERRQRFTRLLPRPERLRRAPGPGRGRSGRRRSSRCSDSKPSPTGRRCRCRSAPAGWSRSARALASEPAVMLLDEPSSGLDVHETEQLGDALRRVRQDRGTAFVLVEHNVEFVLGLSDRVTVLDFGRVLTEGLPEEVRDSPEVQAAYFGAPLDAPSTHRSTHRSTHLEHRSTHRSLTATRPNRGSPMTAEATARRCCGSPISRWRTAKRERCSACRSTCRAGSVTTVLGANGAGKSSLASAIAGVVKPTRRVHRVRRCGHHGLDGAPRLQARPRVRARVAQHLPAPLRARQLWAQLRFTVAGGAAPATRCDRAFEMFPVLAERRRQQAGTLSGGEQQMLSLARVLAAPPKLLIADEMSLGLAPLDGRPRVRVAREGARRGRHRAAHRAVRGTGAGLRRRRGRCSATGSWAGGARPATPAANCSPSTSGARPPPPSDQAVRGVEVDELDQLLLTA